MATVQEFLTPVLKRLSQSNVPLGLVTHGINRATDLIFDRLWKRDSDLIIKHLRLNLATGNPDSFLPDEFRGLKGRPFISGKNDRLMPATEEAIVKHDGESGEPKYFEVNADTIRVYPTPDQSYTLKGRYYEHPGAIYSFDETMPFLDIFNMAYEEAVYRVVKEGVRVTVAPDFVAFITDAVDDVLPVRERYAPVRRKIRDF